MVAAGWWVDSANLHAAHTRSPVQVCYATLAIGRFSTYALLSGRPGPAAYAAALASPPTLRHMAHVGGAFNDVPTMQALTLATDQVRTRNHFFAAHMCMHVARSFFFSCCFRAASVLPPRAASGLLTLFCHMFSSSSPATRRTRGSCHTGTARSVCFGCGRLTGRHGWTT